jgi:S-(hydroxymethyl)glutathione dehydrogenase/alcohol dehydrogenase
MSLYPVTFKAAVLEAQQKPLVLQDVVFRGPLQVGQVLVKLQVSGICGKQLEEIDGADGKDSFLPHLLGHEGSGHVVDIGPGVTKVHVGDFVVLHWRKGSGINSPVPQYERPDGSTINAGWVTTFNEFAVVSENRVTGIPGDSDPIVAALLGCAVTTGVGVAVNQAKINPYDTVVVYGCGGVGLCVIQGARLGHPRKLIAVDVNEAALEAARKFGATDVVNASRQDASSAIRELTGGKGASKVLINTGNTRAIETALESAAVPGECYFVGRPPRHVKISVDPLAIFQERNIFGSHGGDSVPDRDIPTYMALNDEGALQLSALVGKVVPFVEINNAVSAVRSGQPGRCIVSF